MKNIAVVLVYCQAFLILNIFFGRTLLQMESVWGGTNVAPNYPGWNSNPSPSLWADQTTKGVKTEQEILVCITLI